MGQRGRRARARLPRHVPRRRVLASGRQHPADRRGRPARRRRPGATLIRGIATGYEIQIDLVRAISLHKHKIDHVAHLGPSAAAGIGTLLGLPAETIFQAIGQALHTTTATRQSRKGEISTWKAYAPAFAGKMAVEAVDRAMRGETSPTPIYEGEDGVIAWLLDGPDASLRRAAARAPARPSGRSSTATRRSTRPNTRRRPGSTWPASCTASTPSSPTPATSSRSSCTPRHHTHYVIGSGANDPQKYDPHRLARDARPLDPVHLHRRPAGRRLAPRRLVRARARRPAGHRRAVAQGHDRRGRGVDAPLPLRRPEREGLRRPRRDHARRRTADRRRDRRRRRAPARRPAVRPRATTSRKFRTLAEPRARGGRDRALPRRSPSACPSSAPTSSCGSSPIVAAAPGLLAGRSAPPKGLSDAVLLPTRPRAEKRATLPRAARVRRAAAVPRRVQPAVGQAHRAARASTASTSRARCSRPTSACPTSASPRSPRSPRARSRSPG